MTNTAIWQRANGRFAMVAFWAIVGALYSFQILYITKYLFVNRHNP